MNILELESKGHIKGLTLRFMEDCDKVNFVLLHGSYLNIVRNDSRVEYTEKSLGHIDLNKEINSILMLQINNYSLYDLFLFKIRNMSVSMYGINFRYYRNFPFNKRFSQFFKHIFYSIIFSDLLHVGLQNKSKFIVDPIIDGLRKLEVKNNKNFRLLVCGYIDKHKKVLELIDACILLGFDLYILGEIEYDYSMLIRSKINEDVKNIHVSYERFEVQDIYDINPHLIYACYDDFYHTSGMPHLAAQLGIPVLVNNNSVMTRQVLNYKLGICCIPEFFYILESIQFIRNNYQFLVSAMDCENYLHSFDIRNFILKIDEHFKF